MDERQLAAMHPVAKSGMIEVRPFRPLTGLRA
jgi:hypothetical protein